MFGEELIDVPIQETDDLAEFCPCKASLSPLELRNLALMHTKHRGQPRLRDPSLKPHCLEGLPAFQRDGVRVIGREPRPRDRVRRLREAPRHENSITPPESRRFDCGDTSVCESKEPVLTRDVDGQLRVDSLDLAVFFRDESERVGTFIDSLSVSGEVVARNPAPGRQTGYGNESPVLKLDYRVGAYALPTFPSFSRDPRGDDIDDLQTVAAEDSQPSLCRVD